MRDITIPVSGKSKRPTGVYQRLTPQWQESVRAELRDRGVNQTWLAQQIGATKGAVSQMLAQGARTSRLVDVVCKLLELPPPSFDDERDHEFHEMGRKLRLLDPRFYDETFARMKRRVSRG
jgi:hypothetical protein